MKRPTPRWPTLIMAIALVGAAVMAVCAQSGGQDQQGASGGRTSDAAVKSVATKPATAGTKAPKAATNSATTRANTPRTAAKLPTSAPAGDSKSIEGKWWTTGNDFGTSQVMFTQDGSSVSGSITYADGRTGNLTGVLVDKKLNYSWTNSSGEQGTGWLEQSWNNFLGGSYRNQRGASGSWTLTRIAGHWCFGGSRNRIRTVTHNERGQVFFLTDDSGEEVGHLEGPSIFLHGEFGSIKGTMYYKTNRVDFETGTYWTWCGR